MDPYENLANAIILQAVKDYRQARHKLKKRPKNEAARETITECESFFRSDWFTTLTAVDGEALLKRLQKEDGR